MQWPGLRTQAWFSGREHGQPTPTRPTFRCTACGVLERLPKSARLP